MNQALYAHMNNKRKMKKKKEGILDVVNLTPTHPKPAHFIGQLTHTLQEKSLFPKEEGLSIESAVLK
jgi:hypothetical protein